MIDISHSKTIRNGLSLNNKVGIFEVVGSPIGQDLGVPQGSLAIDYSTPALWFKQSTINTDWIIINNNISTTNLKFETISAKNPNTGLIESVYNDKDILIGSL